MEFARLSGGLQLKVNISLRSIYVSYFQWHLVSGCNKGPPYASKKAPVFYSLQSFATGGDHFGGVKQHAKRRLGLVHTHLMQV